MNRRSRLVVCSFVACMPVQAYALDQADVIQAAYSAGFTPESVSLLGLQDGEISSGLAAIASAAGLINERQQDTATLDALLSQRGELLQERSNPNANYVAIDEDLSELDDQIANIRTEIAGVDASLAAVAFNAVGPYDEWILAHYLASREHSVPAEFRVLSLEPAQWKALQRALRAEQRAERLGTGLDAESAALLDGYREIGDVGTAEARVEVNLESNSALFAAFDPQD